MHKRLLAAGAAAAVLAVGLPSRANGRYPGGNQLVFSPEDPNYMILRTTYAILPSSDNGITWRYLCEGVIGLPSDQGEDPSLGIMSNGNLIVGVPGVSDFGRGMNLSTDLGCNWSCQGGNLLNQSIVDLAVRPDDPSKAVAVIGTLLPIDGAETFANQVYETTDNGQTWTALSSLLDARLTINTIDVTKTDPDRIYITGTIGYSQFARAVFLVSMDHGKTWTESTVPQFDPVQESGLYIGAIDPGNADRVYMRSAAVKAGGLSRVYYTTNAGAGGGASAALDASDDGGPLPGGVTFALAESLPADGGFDTPEAGMFDITGELLGMALSPDGSKLYVGTLESGLWIAQTSDMMFEPKNPNLAIQCLATRGNELWGCSTVYKPGDFTLGVSTDDGATWQPRIQYVESICSAVDCAPNPGGPLGCGADGNGSECKDVFDTWCASYDTSHACGTCPSGDAGSITSPTGDGGSTGDGGPTMKPVPPSSSSCSCTAVGRGGDADFAAGLAFATLAGLAFTRRRRR